MTTASREPMSSELDGEPVPDYRAAVELTGRMFVVVGAGRGMGRQTCHALAQLGAARILCADVDPARARRVADEVGVGVPWHGDVTSLEARGDLVRTCRAVLERLDGFVDIVGMASWATVDELTPEVWQHDLRVCLDQAVWLSRDLLAQMAAGGGGSMVFISSVSGLYGARNHAAYGAAKAALQSWVRSLAVEAAARGIRVNSVAPGTMLTPRMRELWDADRREALARNTPLGRIGSSSDIARVVGFLLSDLAAFVTGQTLVVDGGVGVKFPFEVGVPAVG